MSRPFPNNMLSAQSARRKNTELPTYLRYSGMSALLITRSPPVNLLEVTTTPVTTIRPRHRRRRLAFRQRRGIAERAIEATGFEGIGQGNTARRVPDPPRP